MVDKKHPNMYVFLVELQTEQSDTTTMLEQLDSGQWVSSKMKQAEDRLISIVSRYDEFIENYYNLTYIRNLSHYITMYRNFNCLKHVLQNKKT